MDQETSKKLDRIETLVEDLAAVTAKNLALVTEKCEEIATKKDLAIIKEELLGKIHDVQRAIDFEFERQSALEARVSKVESELHI